MKTAIITGAYGAIGYAIARNIAEAGYQTWLIGRDEKKLQATAAEISRETGNPEIFFEPLDLSSKKAIETLAGRWLTLTTCFA